MLQKERLPILFAVVALAMLAACAAPYPVPDDSLASSGSSVRPPAGWASSTYSGPSAIYGAVRGSIP